VLGELQRLLHRRRVRERLFQRGGALGGVAQAERAERAGELVRLALRARPQILVERADHHRGDGVVQHVDPLERDRTRLLPQALHHRVEPPPRWHQGSR